MDRAGHHRRQEDHRVLARASGAAGQRPRHPRAPRRPRRLAGLLPRRGTVRRGRQAARRHRGIGAEGPAADERQPARQRRSAAQRPAPARLPVLRRGRARTRGHRRRSHPGPRSVAHRGDPAQPRQLPHLRPRRDRLQPVAGRVRRHRQAMERRPRRARGRRAPGPGRPRGGDAVRTPVPGLARGLSADRQTRPVQLLRGVHPHHRLDVQPARQMAEGHRRDPVAAAHREPELPAVQPRVASGPQRVLPSGPRLHRPRREQERQGGAGLPAAGRQHAAVAPTTTACARASTSTSSSRASSPPPTS